jgi:uncharacterized membrane protein
MGSSRRLERALKSDAPLAAARHKGVIGDEIADEIEWDDAVVIGRTVLINRPREELYAFWRDVSNLPRFMQNIERIDVIDERRSHWVVGSPGGTVEWDSVIVEELPGERIGWASDEGADVKNTGVVEFRDNSAGRGTEVSATILYDPPAGDLGRRIAKLFGKEPKVQARRDLRRFKQLMETGEISTAEAPYAAPRGDK